MLLAGREQYSQHTAGNRMFNLMGSKPRRAGTKRRSYVFWKHATVPLASEEQVPLAQKKKQGKGELKRRASMVAIRRPRGGLARRVRPSSRA